LEELVNRYPEHKLYPLACFQLYKEYYLARDNEKSEYYENLILEKYPNSHFAQIIKDPDYYKKMEAVRNEANDFYTLVYDAFKNADYALVVKLANEGISKYPTPELLPKFDFLKTIALGKLNGNDTLKILLKEISRNYPTTEIDTAAVGILEVLKRLEASTASTTQSDTTQSRQPAVTQSASIYTYDDNAFHFVIVIVDVKDFNVEPLKGQITSFNRDFFRLEKFEVTSFYIDETIQMISIIKFPNKSKAMDYYKLMKTDTKYLDDLNSSSSAKIYVITDANYTAFYRNKDKRSDYEKFFTEYYF